MTVNSREKGATWERQVCSAFAAWWGCPFRRTPLSGGWAKEVLTGDIVPINPPTPFPFSVECKATEAWSIDGLLFSALSGGFSTSELGRYLCQCWGDCPDAQIPLLVAKRNRKPPVVVSPAVFLERLRPDYMRQALIVINLPELPTLAVSPLTALTTSSIADAVVASKRALSCMAKTPRGYVAGLSSKKGLQTAPRICEKEQRT